MAPNQTVTLTTPFIGYQGPTIQEPAPTSSYPVSISNVCFWTSAPNKQSDANHQNDATCTDVSFIATVGIKNIAQQPTTISCYPNPFADSFEVNANNDIISGIDVYTVDGKLIKQLSALNTQTTTVALPDVASGFYFLKVILQNGQSQIFKTIKN